MRPEGRPLRAIKSVARRMIIVIVSVQSGLDRHLGYSLQRLPLKCCSERRTEYFQNEGRIFSGEEAAISERLEPFRGIGNRGVEAVTDLPYGSEAFVGDHCLRDTGITRELRGQSREREQFGRGIKRANIRGTGQEIAARERHGQVCHFSSVG